MSQTTRPAETQNEQVTLRAKQERLLKILSGYGPLVVAFSGGVDSTVVAQAARIACGESAVAVTAVSPSLPEEELAQAVHIARQIGIRHVLLQTGEFQNSQYVSNPWNRCYFCKSELYSHLQPLLSGWGVGVIVNGANLDDRGDHRPGMTASAEYDVRSPLIEAECTKADVRRLARQWNLPNWDKPAAPCLSSRIAYGIPVTPERVRRVDEAERFLRKLLGISELRVRLEADDLARIEVPLVHLVQLTVPIQREQIIRRFQELGFRAVTLDLEGFRSGSLNRLLPTDQLVVLNVPERSESS